MFRDGSGNFQGPQSLPQNFQNVSNFYVLDVATLNTYGWFLFADAIAPTFDPTTQSISFAFILDVTTNIVNKVWTITALTTAEQTAYAATQVTALASAKQAAANSIDTKAESVRLKYITNGAGQAAVYIEKAEQATDYVAAGYPTDLSTYPFIHAEVDATGNTATVCANNILAQKSAWITKGADIERQRLLGKANVTAATSIAGVATVTQTAIAALDAL